MAVWSSGSTAVGDWLSGTVSTIRGRTQCAGTSGGRFERLQNPEPYSGIFPVERSMGICILWFREYRNGWMRTDQPFHGGDRTYRQYFIYTEVCGRYECQYGILCRWSRNRLDAYDCRSFRTWNKLCTAYKLVRRHSQIRAFGRTSDHLQYGTGWFYKPGTFYRPFRADRGGQSTDQWSEQ